MSHKKPVPSAKELSEAYFKEGATISSLARTYETSNPTVRKWLIDYGIKRKSQAQAIREVKSVSQVEQPKQTEFCDFYDTHSLKDIQKKYGIGQETAYMWIESMCGGPREHTESCLIGKSKQFSHMNFTRDQIKVLYNPTLPLSVLAEKLGVSYSKVRSLMKEHDIPVTTPWRSGAEILLSDYCKEVLPNDDWVLNDRRTIAPLELDIVNHTKKIAIEYCGIYWHSETFGNKHKSYHYDKFKLCQEKGYKLITVFESDELDKVKRLIDTSLGVNTKIFARKTITKQIKTLEAKPFHKEHHLSGHVGSSVHFGLYHDDNLVMVMSLGKSRFNTSYKYEITRMTSHSDYTVVGGASKLFSAFVKTFKPSSVITYADLRFGDGNVYEKIGFTKHQVSPPNYWYFKKGNTSLQSRVKYQKHKLKSLLSTFNDSLTEYENMTLNGYGRIWDCGNGVYTWER